MKGFFTGDYDRDGAFKFFKTIFEDSIENRRGHIEDTVIYLLRHTQLLPRQMIWYLNSAIQLALADDKNYDLTKLESHYIKDAIKSKEEMCATEVIDSYRAIFPEGPSIMDHLNNFPFIATYDELRKNWASFGAKKVLAKYDEFPEVVVEADRFIRFLIEAGVIGRVEDSSRENESGYINAVYEYTLPQKLRLNSKDYFAIHPMFSNYASISRYQELDPYKGIYPKGTGQHAVDDKLLIRKKFMLL